MSQSEEEVLPGQWQRLRRVAHEALAVRRDLESLGVDADVGRRRVVDHVRLADAPRLPRHFDALREAILLSHAGVRRRLRHEAHARGAHGLPEGAEHRPHQHGLRGWDGRVGVAHLCPSDRAPLDDHLWLRPEHRRLPEADVRQLPDLEAPHGVRHPVSDRGVNRVLGDVALDARVVVPPRGSVLRQRPPLQLHLGGCLPGTRHDLAHAAHGLRV
mmetsp:Transcript_84460/g.212974  ORF Transcript_84460/g.212974 Transcript_84460/m.212974 type:complete len:215 (-) Transcript_84460:328-972(-)